MRRLTVKLVAAAWAALSIGAHAQETPPARPAVPTDACVSANHRAFDFWVGEWDAYSAGAPERPAGRSTIALEDRGCVITERWRSLRVAYSGRSLNMYDALAGKWLQYWMDSTGDITRFEGGPNAQGEMVLVARDDVAPNQPSAHSRRMTFTPNPDGSVRQHGEASTDGGATWVTTYDFIYRRAALPPPISP